jgi:DNA-binding MarR family transcriptional regulator
MTGQKQGAAVLAEAPAAKRRGFALHSSPNYLFWCLHKTSMSVISEELDRVGADITPVQYAVLIAIQAQPGIDQASLASVIAYDRATIGGVLDRLEKKRLLCRRIHPQDRRARALFLEPAGETLVNEVEEVVNAAQQRILSPLPREERAKFLSMVALLLRDDLPHDVEV